MIKGIFFDAHGILYERQETSTPYANRLLATRGYPTEVSPTDKVRLADLREQASIGRVAPETYWDEFLKAHAVESAAERSEIATLILQRPHEVYELPGASSTLHELKRRGFILGVITDTMYSPAWKRSWLKKIGVAQFLDVLICSTEVGVHKPEPGIYLAALSHARITPAESVFVGHTDYELDGARRVGMTTIAVNHAPGTAADYHIRSLDDLLAVPILQAAQ